LTTKELDQLTNHLDKHMEQHGVAESFGIHVADILRRKWSGDTDILATFFSSALSSVDEDRGCFDLLVRWTMDRLGWFRFRQMLPDILMVHEMLKRLQYTKTDRFTFNDLDNHGWFIPHVDKRLFVLESQSRMKLVIIDKTDFAETIHVRRVWYRHDEDRNHSYRKLLPLSWYHKHDWTPKYGDFRDPGYVATYKQYLGDISVMTQKQVEGSGYYWHELEGLAFDINSTLTVLYEHKTERTSQLRNNKKDH